jgi:competence protein ComEC
METGDSGAAGGRSIAEAVGLSGQSSALPGTDTDLLLQSVLLFATVSTAVLLCAVIPAISSRISNGHLLRFRILPLLYLASITLFGMFQFNRSQISMAADELLLQHFGEEEMLFFGTIRVDRSTRSGNRMMTVNVDSVQIQGLPTWKRGFLTEILVRSDSLRGVAGSRLHFRGDLQPPPSPRNPNQFDYAAFLARRGIHTQVFVSEIPHHDFHGTPGFWLRQQIRIRSSVDSLFSGANAGLARAIILGDRSDLDPDLRTGFSRAGLAHLMAVSGMHVGFILMPVWLVLPWFRRSAALRATGLALGGTLLLFYAGITGFSVSVSRASLMAFFMMLARLFHKPGTSMNILGAAALMLLVLDPLMLFDVGFQLSFLAVIIILTTLPGTRYMLPPSHRYRKTGSLFQFIMVSVLVQGGLYPLLIHYFNEFSVAGPLSNTLAVPFVQFMFLWTFLCLGISLVQPDMAVIANIPGDFVLTALTVYVARIGAHPASWIEGTLPGPWLFGVWFFATALLASLRLPAVRFKMAAGLLLCLVMLQTVQLHDRLRPPVLEVIFWDVGQGDAVLLRTPGGYHYLYDAGVWSPGSDSAERTILPELKAMGIRRLDGVILSHPHADHIGGIVTLMHHIPIDTIYQSPVPHDTRLYHRYMGLAAEKEIPVRLLTSGQLIATDPSLPMMVLAPSERIRASDPNNLSVVLMVKYGDTRLLLTGDAEVEAEEFLTAQFGTFLRADLLKVGHHASKTSSTAPFLEMVRAPEAVASLAVRNRYRHPHPEATLRLREAGTHARFTSLEGAVIYRSDGARFMHIPW